MEEEATGIEEVAEEDTGTRLKAYFRGSGTGRKVIYALRRYLESLQRLHRMPFSYKVEAAFLPEQMWGEGWKLFFKPVQVTSRIVVGPPWAMVRLKKGLVFVEINPGVAFGTGTHPTTKLCIRALDKKLRAKGKTVLDVGTGSGVLSIVAARLGAREVWGIDTDGASVENARENVERNAVAHLIRIRRGSIGSIRRRFDVVVANNDLKVLRRMKSPFLRRLNPRGLLILSGILQRDVAGIRTSYLETGQFAVGKVFCEEEWACLIFQKRT